MAGGVGVKKGKKNRKHNRHKLRSPSAKAYAIEGRYFKNKKKKLVKHLKLHGADTQASARLKELK